eukprot:54812-Amphidinium_carterae.1
MRSSRSKHSTLSLSGKVRVDATRSRRVPAGCSIELLRYMLIALDLELRDEAKDRAALAGPPGNIGAANTLDNGTARDGALLE